ncbi:MAG: DUF2974 domain-containing protein, partial [Planctomycetales bacterium]|nr:DUF2974 domain-containing protein [Planctomycetales bacterium]
MFKIASLRSTAFTWDAALSLAYASKLAYDPPQLVLKTLKSDWGFGAAQFLDRADTQGFVALGDGVVLVAFRGTESLGDWLGNLDVGWTDMPPAGKMHRGFVEAFDLVAQDLATLLTPAKIAGRKVWFTGHSLGGALCAVAAVRLHNLLHVHSIYTFGQPRLGDADTRNFFADSLNDRYFRFVNDRDLIARVPPGFEHVGTLIHFDAHGNVERAAIEAARVALEVPSLTPEEFEALKADIKATKADMRVLGMPEGAPTLDRSLEGLIPGIPDHRLERYITAIRRQTGSVAKGETLAAERVVRSALEAVREKSGDLKPTEAISALVRLRDSRAKLPDSVKAGPRNGNIMSVRGTLDALRQLETDPNVVSLQISRDAGFSELATSLPFVHGDIVHRPPIAERGDKALLGLIDTGIDVLHEAFLDDQGVSRILAVWDQSNNTGLTPAAADPACFSSMTYGTLYLASDIAEMLAGNKTAPLNLRDFREHGTHVASIAAGSAVGLLSDGMAPAARLVVV